MQFPQLLFIDTSANQRSPVKVCVELRWTAIGKRSNISDEANRQLPSTNCISCSHWEKTDVHVVEVLSVAW